MKITKIKIKNLNKKKLKKIMIKEKYKSIKKIEVVST